MSSTVPEPRQPREVPPEHGTVGELLRFIEKHSIGSGAVLAVWDHENDAPSEVSLIEFKVRSDGQMTVVVYP